MPALGQKRTSEQVRISPGAGREAESVGLRNLQTVASGVAKPEVSSTSDLDKSNLTC